MPSAHAYMYIQYSFENLIMSWKFACAFQVPSVPQLESICINQHRRQRAMLTTSKSAA